MKCHRTTHREQLVQKPFLRLYHEELQDSHVIRPMLAALLGKGRKGRQHSAQRRQQKDQPHAGEGPNADFGTSFFGLEEVVAELSPETRRCALPVVPNP